MSTTEEYRTQRRDQWLRANVENRADAPIEVQIDPVGKGFFMLYGGPNSEGTLHVGSCPNLLRSANARSGRRSLFFETNLTPEDIRRSCKTCLKYPPLPGSSFLGETPASIKAREDARKQERRTYDFQQEMAQAVSRAQRRAREEVLTKYAVEVDALTTLYLGQERAEVESRFRDVEPAGLFVTT